MKTKKILSLKVALFGILSLATLIFTNSNVFGGGACPVFNGTLAIAIPNVTAGAQTNYTLTGTAPGNPNLTSSAGNTVVITFAAGTNISNLNLSTSTFNGVFLNTLSGVIFLNTLTFTLPAPGLGQNDPINIVLNNIFNPPAGTYTLTVAIDNDCISGSQTNNFTSDPPYTIIGAPPWTITGNDDIGDINFNDNFIGTLPGSTNKDFAIRTNNSERMRVIGNASFNTGFVAIGSILPIDDVSSLLGVKGNAAIGTNFYNTSFTPPTNGLIVQGRTGIGIETPDRKLEILDNTGPQLRLTETDATNFTDFQTTAAGHLFIDPINNVGIDVLLPQEKLHVSARIRTNALAGATINPATFNAPLGIVVADGAGTLRHKIAFTGSDAVVLRGDGTFAPMPGNFSGFANPTATIGLTAINGTATTAMRSDAAPALSQSIVPTWTGTHTFSNATFSALFTGGNVGIGITSPLFRLDVAGGSINTDTDYRINNLRVLSIPGASNVFVGDSTGHINSGGNNTFAGRAAGGNNTTGSNNTFMGRLAGSNNFGNDFNTFTGALSGQNNSGFNNSFFGWLSGSNNTGNFNAIYGSNSGSFNSGTNNSFFGALTGIINSGNNNSFFGFNAGAVNTGGANNTFVGVAAGNQNQTGSDNTFIGANAGSPAFQTFNNATAIGANASVTADNALILGNNANIGIGTTNPTAKLNVVSSGAASNVFRAFASVGNSRIDMNEDASNLVSISGHNQFGFLNLRLTPDGSSFFNGGNVGIGILAPARKLEILDPSAAQLRLARAAGTTFTDFRTDFSGFLIISPSGNRVGINTIPSHSLHVSGNARIENLPLNNTLNNLVVSDANGVLFSRDISTLPADNDWTVDILNNRTTLTNIGHNVGIGTIIPAHRLDVAGNISLSGSIVNGTLDSPVIAAPDGGAGQVSVDDPFYISNNMRVSGQFSVTDGNVGIGTLSPLTQLDVNGSGRFSGNLTVNGFVGINGFPPIFPIFLNGLGVSNSGWIIISDANFKTNITPLTNSLNLVKQLEGIYFDWDTTNNNFNFPSGRKIGLIAQDVQNVIPEVVTVDDSGRYSLDYDHIVPVLIEAVKEQQLTIDSLITLINNQPNNISLQNQIDSIKSCLANLPQGLACPGGGNMQKTGSGYENQKYCITSVITIEPDNTIVNKGTELEQNIPNPFRYRTQFDYYIGEEGNVELLITNELGQQITTLVSEHQEEGNYSVDWNTTDIAPGFYYYTLRVDGKDWVKKAVRIK